jgi:hypothetical protein
VSGQLHGRAALSPGKEPLDTFSTGGWVGLRTCLDDVERRKILSLQGLELRPLRRPTRTKSLYRLHYPGSRIKYGTVHKIATAQPLSASRWHGVGQPSGDPYHAVQNISHLNACASDTCLTALLPCSLCRRLAWLGLPERRDTVRHLYCVCITSEVSSLSRSDVHCYVIIRKLRARVSK